MSRCRFLFRTLHNLRALPRSLSRVSCSRAARLFLRRPFSPKPSDNPCLCSPPCFPLLLLLSFPRSVFIASCIFHYPPPPSIPLGVFVPFFLSLSLSLFLLLGSSSVCFSSLVFPSNSPRLVRNGNGRCPTDSDGCLLSLSLSLSLSPS